MIKKILIVDDDKIWLRLIQKKFEKYRETFSAQTAANGVEAVEVLKQQAISLVVTDMQMPEMDGLALLAHLSEYYPEIPVIVVTAYSTPKLKKTVLLRGGAGYIEKPFVIEDLATKITDILKRESEGGILQTVPLEMFIQLIEMEQKTCTIRVFNKNNQKKGVLFFRDGELLDARVPGIQGEKAAYEIFSWDEVSLTIQDTCAVNDKKIEKDLQAILLDAMRLKDEAADSRTGGEIQHDATDVVETDGVFAEPSPEPPAPDAPEKDWEQLLRNEKGVLEISEDSTWAAQVKTAQDIGKLLDAGQLLACFFGKGESRDVIVVPGAKTKAVFIDPKSARDPIMEVLVQNVKIP